MKKALLLFFAFCLLPNCCFSQENDSISISEKKKIFPEIKDYVNDTENILTDDEIIILNTTLENFDQDSNHRIFIVTVFSIAPYETMFDYSLALARHINVNLELGSKIVIVLSKNSRQIHIQNVDEIRVQLTDEETETIIDNFIVPEFKNGNYNKGLSNCISEIKKQLK